MNKDNIILENFLQLTSYTCPYRSESSLVERMIGLGIFPNDIHKDNFDNFYYKIGESRTIFTAHLDTVGACTPVSHIIEGNIIKTDGKSILGADDKAGVTILLHMIRNNVPGTYYFFVGEESGCIGSSDASRLGQFKGLYDRIISFDRRGLNSIITHQSFTRCCSDKFADDLCNRLNKFGFKYTKDDGGIYTDSAEFTRLIPECTNISVGYYNEHTIHESQDISHLERLAEACLHINWEELPTIRDASQVEYWSYSKNYSTNYPTQSSGYIYERDDYYNEDFYASFSPNHIKSSKKTRRSGSKNVKYSKKDERFNSYYDEIMDSFMDGKLKKEEVFWLRDNFFDMSSKSDKEFYEILLASSID